MLREVLQMVRPIMFALAAATAAAAILSAPAQAQVAGERQPGATARPLPEVERVQPNVGGLGVATEPADPVRFACRMNLLRLHISLPEERSGIWFADFFDGDAAAPEEDAVAAACLSLLDEPLVRFDSDLPPTPTWTGSDRTPR
jgi:ABC-type amino acid transport substrate-binding protein